MYRAVALLLFFVTPLAIAAGNGGENESEPTELPKLQGAWAQKMVTSSVSDVPVVGEVVSQTTSYRVVQVEQQDRRLELTSKICDVDIVSDQGAVETHLPKRFVTALEPVVRTAYLKPRDSGYYLFAPRHMEVLGAKLDSPADDSLPDQADDPRVYDQDQDGKPGMTVRVSGLIDGEIRIVQKSWNRLWGKILDGDRIAGRVKWDAEQKVLESTSRFLSDPPDSKPHADERQSYFRMARVDQQTGCSDVLERRAELF